MVLEDASEDFFTDSKSERTKCMKRKICSVVFVLLFTFMAFPVLLFAQDSESLSTNPEEGVQTSDLSLWMQLRDAVASEDEAAVAEIFDSLDLSVPATLDYASSLLQKLEPFYVVVLNPKGTGSTSYSVVVYPSVSVVAHYVSKENGGWRLFARFYPEEVPSRTSPEVFALQTVSGERIPFSREEGYYSGQFFYRGYYPTETGYVYFSIHPERFLSAEMPPIEELGTIDIRPFLRADVPSEAPFSPWLWIALPVGAVVIAGGAAFVLIRKKRKSSPNP